MVQHSDRFLRADGQVNEQVLLAACWRKDGEALAFLIKHYKPDVEAGVARALLCYPNDHPMT